MKRRRRIARAIRLAAFARLVVPAVLGVVLSVTRGVVSGFRAAWIGGPY